MFRRRPFRRRKSFSRKRPLARVRRTWLTSMNALVCDPVEVPLGPCGEAPAPQKGRIILVDNSVLESSFSDRASVKRIVGDLWFFPTYDGTDPFTCLESLTAAGSFFPQMFMGLRKLQTNANGDVLSADPMVSDFDFSEAEWLRTWQHTWFPRLSTKYVFPYTVHSCGVAICPDVHTAGLLDNDFVDGTGTINIETDCGDPESVSCTAEQDDRCEAIAKYPDPWHVHFDIKKSIALREWEELGLDLEVVYSDASTLVNPRLQIVGGIKCLLQF